ncbi:rod shape-determining protein MreC [Patescibacteria group bacterium]|nr:rod shape-determining protein MreC [Patescibacteria group bacterium]MBU4162213.1 rod shape-determining protein MreC [Patescibacteria group bacterium]
MMYWIKKNQKFFWLVVAIFVIMIFVFLHRPIRSVFHSISNSLESWCWEKGQNDSNFWIGFFNATNIKIQNQNLKQENQALLGDLLGFKELEEENQRLRNALELGLAEEFKLKETVILAKDAMMDYVIINKGKQDGISEGMAVITYEKVLVGKVAEVYQDSCQVRLATDAGTKFGVKIADTNIQALAKGEGDEKLTLDLMPKDVDIPIGALVYTSGPEGGYPIGLLIGTISETSNADAEPFQTAKIDNFFKVLNATLLFVIIN